jgi:hypothetical protein
MYNEYESRALFKARLHELEGHIREQSYIRQLKKDKKKNHLLGWFTKDAAVQTHCQDPASCCV